MIDISRSIEISVEREYCRRSLANFAKRAWHVLEPSAELKWGWCLDAICEHLEAVTRGHISQIVINVPPGTMKSLLTSVIWPAWEWGPCNMPSKRFVGVAHSEKLSLRDNMKCRRLIESDWYQRLWPIELVQDQNAKGKFENTSTGLREAVAFTGITGIRGDRVVFDDPHSVSAANSPDVIYRDSTLFRESIPTRINNDESAIVIIMQRLNQADVSQVAIDLGYDHLCIPMRYDPENTTESPIGWVDPRTEPDELMFPERFAEDHVAMLERSLGPFAVAGQLQQRPVPREGGLFKRDWFNMVDDIPAGTVFCRGWDVAATARSKNARADYTAGVKLGLTPQGRYIIAHAVRAQIDASAVDGFLSDIAKVDGPLCQISFPQDPGASGKFKAQEVVKTLAGFRVHTSAETGSKQDRADAFASQARIGNVDVLRGVWNDAYFDEMCIFPGGEHDDQVDATSRAFMCLAENTNVIYNAAIYV